MIVQSSTERTSEQMRYMVKVPANGVYLPNASHIGFDEYQARHGDIVVFRITYSDGSTSDRIGRIVGMVTHDGMGNEFRESTGRGKQTRRAAHFVVLAPDEIVRHAYCLYIDRKDIVQCRRPPNTAFVAWLMGGELPSVKTILDVVNYGSMTDQYFSNCAPDGTLRDTWRETHPHFGGRKDPS